MKLYIKQRVFAFYNSYDIYNEAEEILFTVKGELSFGKKLKIFDADGAEIGLIMETPFSFGYCYEIYRGNKHAGYGQIGTIKSKISFTKTIFDVDFNGWHIEGDLYAYDLVVKDDRNIPIATISKEFFEFSDTFVVETDGPQDLFSLVSVMIITDLLHDR